MYSILLWLLKGQCHEIFASLFGQKTKLRPFTVRTCYNGFVKVHKTVFACSSGPRYSIWAKNRSQKSCDSVPLTVVLLFYYWFAVFLHLQYYWLSTNVRFILCAIQLLCYCTIIFIFTSLPCKLVDSFCCSLFLSSKTTTVYTVYLILWDYFFNMNASGEAYTILGTAKQYGYHFHPSTTNTQHTGRSSKYTKGGGASRSVLMY